MGVIKKKARDAFLNRPRKDYRTFKSLTLDDLEARMQSLPVKPPIWYKLDLVQRICFIIGAQLHRFVWLLDTGMGKSLLSISLIRYFRRLGIVKHALILVPNKINKTEWESELLKHSPNSSYLILKGSSAEKWAALEQSNALFVFETYAGLTRMVCVKEKRKKKAGMRLVPDAKLIAKVCSHFQALVCDESPNVGNHTKLPFRICKQISKTAEAVFPMTGTPFNRDPTMLWAQMYLVDHGETLGETLGLFRSIFCKESNNYFSGMPEYKFDKKKESLLNKMIANRSIAYEADAASLPSVVAVPKYVTLPGDASSYYAKARETLIAARGNFTETKNAFLRMRQISSGFVGYEDDETGERAQFVFPDNPKLDLLLSTLQSIRPEYKSIVFFDFNVSGERIAKELDQLKIGNLLMYGKSKNVEKVRHDFINNPKKQVLVLQNKLGIGLNVQVARYGHFFESPVSAIIRKQCQRRVERQKSLYKTVFIYDYITTGTVDEDVLLFHKEGKDLFDAVIRGQVKL